MKETKASKKTKINLLNSNLFILSQSSSSSLQEQTDTKILNQRIKELESQLHSANSKYDEMKNKMNQEIQQERALRQKNEEKWKMKSNEYITKEKETNQLLINVTNKLTEAQTKLQSLENKVNELTQLNQKMQQQSNNKINIMENQLKRTAEFLNNAIRNIQNEIQNEDDVYSNKNSFHKEKCNLNEEIIIDISNDDEDEKNEPKIKKEKNDNNNNNNYNESKSNYTDVNDTRIKDNKNNKEKDIINDIDIDKPQMNYVEQFFEYKTFLPVTNMKRQNKDEKEYNSIQYKTKKIGNTWIKKESKKPIPKINTEQIILSSNSPSDIDHGFSSADDLIIQQPKTTKPLSKKLNSIIEEEDDNTNHKITSSKEDENISENNSDNVSSKSSFSSLVFNSRIQSKDKSNNFISDNNVNIKSKISKNKLISSNYSLLELNKGKTNSNSKTKEINTRIQQRDNLINQINKAMDKINTNNNNDINYNKNNDNILGDIDTNNKMNKQEYSITLKSFENEVTYDEFYKLKNTTNRNTYLKGKRPSFIGLGKNIKVKNPLQKPPFLQSNNINQTIRNKKERDKATGHKCELCQKFYTILEDSENTELICNECSRHKTNENVPSTPQGFYDISI